jgi:hypothetical protein
VFIVVALIVGMKTNANRLGSLKSTKQNLIIVEFFIIATLDNDIGLIIDCFVLCNERRQNVDI